MHNTPIVVFSHLRWDFVYQRPQHLLSRLANIHYLGQRSYAELPKFLKGWDVCLLPFARNESTKFISPTKTLVLLAGLPFAGRLPIRL